MICGRQRTHDGEMSLKGEWLAYGVISGGTGVPTELVQLIES